MSNICIIDDGVNKQSFNFPVVSMFVQNGNVEYRENNVDPISHGTQCAKIIERYGNIDKIFDIAVLDEKGKGKLEHLVAALEYCINLDIDYINLSNGVYFYEFDDPWVMRLEKACNALNNAGVIVLAAQSNRGGITIPAMFDSVISVAQFYMDAPVQAIYRDSDIWISGRHMIKSQNRWRITERCNSFACAYATALATKGKLHSLVFPGVRGDFIVNIINKSYRKRITECPIIFLEHDLFTSMSMEMCNFLRKKGYYANVVENNNLLNIYQYYSKSDILIAEKKDNQVITGDLWITTANGKWHVQGIHYHKMAADLESLIRYIEEYYQ